MIKAVSKRGTAFYLKQYNYGENTGTFYKLLSHIAQFSPTHLPSHNMTRNVVFFRISTNLKRKLSQPELESISNLDGILVEILKFHSNRISSSLDFNSCMVFILDGTSNKLCTFERIIFLKNQIYD